MVLIIAEKPSLARNIAAGVGKCTRRDGYWSLDNLPCIPSRFRFELRQDKDKKSVDSGVLKQFNIISALCNREDVDTIVNAGDADREGEIIVRLCVAHALKTAKTQKRLWLPDQTPETVREALANLGDADEYQNLANEGLALRREFTALRHH